MKKLICASLFLLALTIANAQTLSFEFTANNERLVTMGKAAPSEYAKAMEPKLISFKDNVLLITTISTGKEYSKDNVLRVVEFKKGNLTAYALEVKGKDGLYSYYLYNVSKSASGESRHLVTPYMVNGRCIMEDTFLE